MSEHETRLSRRESERLLDAPATQDSALGRALSAASAPAHPSELRREDAVVAAFHTARLTPSPTYRNNVVSPDKLGSRAAARAVIATAAVVALISGGFALANSSYLPTLPGQASDRATESVAKTPKPTETASETASETSTESTETPAESVETETPTGSATPTPNFTGLCTAFQAAERSSGKSLQSAAFVALASEAGGAELVATYCVDLIGEPEDKPAGKPSVLPTPTDKPTGSPTERPSPGKPTDSPEKSSKGGAKDSTTSGS